MATGQVIPGTFFCFAAAVLLIFVSVSSPTWERVSFLNISSAGTTTHFGALGHTGTTPHVGYTFDLPNFKDSTLSKQVILNLTKTLILHPIAAGLSGIAFLCGPSGIMTFLCSLATLMIMVEWVIDMTLFGIARNRFRHQGFQAEYGNANWLTLAALIALFLASSPHKGKAVDGRKNKYDHFLNRFA